MPDQTLQQQRIKASDASGGISNNVIYDMALRCLSQNNAHGAVLDFGAGQGGFTARLLQANAFDRVTGADLMARPAALPAAVDWLQGDLNQALALPDGAFDAIAALEVIEHLENPRQFFRDCARLLRPDGLLVVTTPNCESWRSLVSLLFRGHSAAFGPGSYPAHITPLLLIDLQRAAQEAGLMPVSVAYSNEGAVPGITRVSWQAATFGLARGRRFSDNFTLVWRRPR